MNSSLSPKGLGMAIALLSALCMLLISLLGLGGYAADAVTNMQAYHIGYDLTAGGIIVGIVEAVIAGYVIGWLTATFYNKYA